MEIIASTSNNTVKLIRSLGEAKGRQEHGLYAAEGDRICEEAIRSGVGFRTLVLAESRAADAITLRAAAATAGAETIVVTDKVFENIADTKTPQGVMLLIPTTADSGGLGAAAAIKRAAVLDRIQDPGNMGTIIRSADAFGFDTIVILKGSVDVYNPKTVRSTMGSLFHLKIVHMESAAECLAALRAEGVKTIAAAADAERSCAEEYISAGEKRAYIIGNEANGISRDLLEGCEIKLRIPMPGEAESLNASVAASVLMYEDMRKGL